MNTPPLHTFIESIIYCPTQVHYYFRTPEGNNLCLYIRQRRGPVATVELIECDDTWNMEFDGVTEIPGLSQKYDINGAGTQEKEEEILEKLESECLGFLRLAYPDVNFPPPTRSTLR